jgi:ParB-like chromosome segregation protein Spo0J
MSVMSLKIWDLAPFVTGGSSLTGSQLSEFDLHELRSSIQEQGIRNLIHVYQDGDQYRVVDGKHRIVAAAEIGLTEIPVYVFDGKTRNPCLEIELQ